MPAVSDNSDDWLDSQLRRVPVPAGLQQRLLRIAVDDLAALDEPLRDVPVPMGLHDRLLRIARPPRWRVRQLALAASLMVGVSLWYGGLAFTLLAGRFAPPVAEAEPLMSWMVEEPRPEISIAEWAVDPPVVETENHRAPHHAREAWSLWDAWVYTNDRAIQQQFDERVRSVGSPHSWWSDEVDLARIEATTGPLVDHQIFGAPPVELPLPGPWHDAPLPRPEGINLPLELAGRLFLLNYDIFPPVTAQSLPATAVPLVASAVGRTDPTSDLHAAGRALTAGQWPDPKSLRTEQFLAGIDPRLPIVETRPVELSTHLGPCNWSRWSADPAQPVAEANLRLLQVGVRARSLPEAERRGTRLTVLVDLSGSMSAARRLEMARGALSWLVDRLEPEDRVRLMGYHQQVLTLIDEAGIEDRAALHAAIESLAVGEGDNLAAGIVAACSAAAADATVFENPARVVLLTDGSTAALPAEAAAAVRRLWNGLPGASPQLDVIELQANSAIGRSLQGLVDSSGGQVLATTDPRQAGWLLVESLRGVSPRVADRLKLTVTFNPRSVLAYRLVGHEPNALAELVAAPLEIDLYDGESALAQIELQLHARPEVEIGQIKLQWQSPRGGPVREVTRRLTRGQLTADPASTPAGWQLAALASATGQWLRRSPLAQHFTPADLAAALDRLNLSSGEDADVRQLRQLLEQAERLRLRRPPQTP